jgi:hypothetical protein
MPWTTDLLAGVAQYLEDHGVGTWQASGAYAPGASVPIFITASPGTPDRIIILTAYPVSDNGTLSDSVQGVQIRTRGTKDPRTVEEIADGVFDALHGLGSVNLGGVWLVHCYRSSGTPLPPDSNGRYERTDNYYLQVARPSEHRTD